LDSNSHRWYFTLSNNSLADRPSLRTCIRISGTPTFVLAKSAKDKLDGVRIVGAQPFAAFQSAIDGLLKSPSPSVPSGKGN
jgi:hypothetical protein